MTQIITPFNPDIVIPNDKNNMTIQSINFSINECNDDIIINIKNSIIRLKIDNVIVWEYDMDFFLHFNNYEHINGNLSIKIPDFIRTTFFPSAMHNVLTASIFCDIDIDISLVINYNDDCCLKDCCLNTDSFEQNTLYNTEQHCETQIHNIRDDTIILSNNYQAVKGFFIECDIYNVDKISLNISFQDYTSYDDDMIQLFCTRISDTLFYYPINSNETYSDTDIKSFHGSLNNRRTDRIKMNIMFKDYHPTTINVYPLTFGYWTYKNNECNNMIFECDFNSTYKTLSHKKQYERVINRPITNEICCISFNEILSNNIYTFCKQCNNVFDIITITQWLDINHTCPMCRKIWHNIRKYKNIHL